MKIDEIIKVASTIATLLLAASEVIKQARLYREESLAKEN